MGASNGGPAFPINRNEFKQDGAMTCTTWDTGMSLRDWFAGQVASAVWSGRVTDGPCTEEELYAGAASICYKIADYLIKARENS